ncbi:DUF6966 domain-containing protein [Novosphingobium cyanobacteriorum]|uniref:DUF6966 domain-containing protein n=1 Tax=Novosphingobium cyanobacteriorum TaxID=3024215 RepID=UPI003F689A5D
MRALELFLSDKNEFWAGNVGRAADEVANSDVHGLRRFLSYFGGMGSLNDLFLHRNGTPLGWENDHLASLVRRAWHLGNELRDQIR